MWVPPSNNSSVKSSVCIAAAITSYTIISINKYKNIPSNKYLGGDTDSAIMLQPLDPKSVGPALGLMKLEYTVAFKQIKSFIILKIIKVILLLNLEGDLAGKDILN